MTITMAIMGLTEEKAQEED